MRIIDLALKDLAQILGDRKALLFLVAMPIVFTIFMGFAYRGGSAEDAAADARIPLAVVDPQPDGRLNRLLLARLEASDALRPISMAQDAALQALSGGDVSGVLLIPPDFSAQAESGATPQLTLVADASGAGGQSLYQLLRVPVSQLMSAVQIARISAEVQAAPAEYSPALELAWSKWEANANRRLVQVEQAVARPQSDWTGGNPYNQASPGILVQFAIFGLVTSGQILVQERKTRTLQRLLTTAIRPWEIVAGHLLAMFAITFLQTMMLILFGQLALRVDYLAEPLGVLLIAVALGLWVASMGLLIGAIAKADDQVVLYSLVVMFLFSALGGTWFPLEASGGAFAAIGRLTPSAWAMTGLQNILIRGLGLDSAWLPAAILLAYAAGFFLLAVWRFTKLEL
jgi:ABC-2 type transport system permease protein